MTKRVFAGIAAVLLVAFNGDRKVMSLCGEERPVPPAVAAPAPHDSSSMRLKKRQTFEGYRKGRFSQDGSLVALVGIDHAVIIDSDTYQTLKRIDRPHCILLSVAISPEGSILAASYQD